MRTETITKNFYKFEELTEQAKQKAIEKLSHINVSHDWWTFTYHDAKNVGLEISSFDIDRNRNAKGIFIDSATKCADLIMKEHGGICETFKTAQKFMCERDELVSKYSDGVNTEIVAEYNEYEFDQECDELESEFLSNILEDYSIILNEECEYLQSETSIVETIEANEYEFDEYGNLA
jgi:hypothetical protein